MPELLKKIKWGAVIKNAVVLILLFGLLFAISGAFDALIELMLESI